MVFNRQNSSTGVAQYSTPQFIESEGKIISFLTFRQFFILIGTGLVCLLLYYTLPFYFFAVLAVLVAGLGGAIAFLKINDASVVTIALHFFTFLTQSKNYTWKKKESAYPVMIKKRPQADIADLAPKDTSSLNKKKNMVELRKR